MAVVGAKSDLRHAVSTQCADQAATVSMHLISVRACVYPCVPLCTNYYDCV